MELLNTSLNLLLLPVIIYYITLIKILDDFKDRLKKVY